MKRHSLAVLGMNTALLSVGAALIAPAQAETPLGLTLSETLIYDTNILKDDRQKQSDVVSSTGVKVFFDKDYGRQNYRASVTGIFQRYKENSDYNNDGYEMSAGVTSEIGANGLVSLDHARSQSLQEFADQGANRYREVITVASTEVNARYGLYGRWGLSGQLSQDEITYDRNDFQDRKTSGARLGVRYSPSDLLYFDVGVKKSESELDKYPVFRTAQTTTEIGESVDRTDINLLTGWTITGVSRLEAQLGWTRERYDKDTLRDFNGWTGRAAWTYTPRGRVSYTLAFNRDTNNSGGFTSFSNSLGFLGEAQKRLTTGIQGSANWQATGKIVGTASLTWRQLEEERRNVGIFASLPSTAVTGYYRAASMGLRYAATRAILLECNLTKYSRSETVLARGFTGESVSCTAGFTID